MPDLGVNIDHIATLRQARRDLDPDPLSAARIAERAGADSIVAHLREDRRHILDKDIFRLRRIVKKKFNMEMSINEGIVRIALKVKPHQATLVPERRQEITTEGGLDVRRHLKRVTQVVSSLERKGIKVSLFIAPSKDQIIQSKKSGAGMIEFHTGVYTLSRSKSAQARELKKLKDMTEFARGLGLNVNAGHGLNYDNVKAVAAIDGIEELNIGHAIVSRAVFVGMFQAVEEMIKLIK